jgi:hypothetical protein
MVKVAQHPATGAVITPSTNNPEFGTIRLDSEHKSMEKGYLNIQKRSAFVRGKLEELNALGLKSGQSLPGKIIKRESFEPFYDNQGPKINPTTAEIILTNGRETYLEFVYTEDANSTDQWVGSNSAEVSAEVENALTEQTV